MIVYNHMSQRLFRSGDESRFLAPTEFSFTYVLGLQRNRQQKHHFHMLLTMKIVSRRMSRHIIQLKEAKIQGAQLAVCPSLLSNSWKARQTF